MENALLGENFKYPLSSLKKHFIALGNTGSGKTVLCKALIEEAALNGIPSILVDPQGDLASLALLAESGSDENKALKYKENVEVVVYTPTSSKGVPISINPLKLPDHNIDHEELVSIINQISMSIVNLLGYDLGNDKGKNAQALLYLALKYLWSNKVRLDNFDQLSKFILNLPDMVLDEASALVSSPKEIDTLAKKLKYLTIGKNELLFQFGEKLDINNLLGKNSQKTRISVIYLNTLENVEEKQFFISALATELYQWMLANPSKDLQAIFMIDEVAPYIPAGMEKPAAKEILKLIYKQARKYGVGCVVGTQNPGDIDYKAFAQFGTWAIGRLTTRQDLKKVELSLSSLNANKIKFILRRLPSLKPGNFLIFCPDAYDDIVHLKVRWLLTEHKTLTDNDIKHLINSKRYKKIVDSKHVNKKLDHAAMLHFPLNYAGKGVDDIIGKYKRKMFRFFGPAKESVSSIKLILTPIYEFNVVKKTRFLFWVKYKAFKVYADALTANILKFCKKGNMKTLYGFDRLVKLNERELELFKTLLKAKKVMTNAELAAKLGLTENFVNKLANELMKNKVLFHAGKIGKAYLWQPVRYQGLTLLIKRVKSQFNNLSNDYVTGEKIKPKLNVTAINKMLQCLFDVNVTDSTLIYYPFYEVRLVDRIGRKRVIKISAVNGKPFN